VSAVRTADVQKRTFYIKKYMDFNLLPRERKWHIFCLLDKRGQAIVFEIEIKESVL